MARLLRDLEYRAVVVTLFVTRALPMWCLVAAAKVLGTGAYWLLRRRRRIAVDNISQALGDRLSRQAIRTMARASFVSFGLSSMPEVVKLRPAFASQHAHAWLQRRAPEATEVFATAKRLHDEHQGCIFVTPHLGSWELLPYVAATLGIPMAVAVRPLDNPRIERLLAEARDGTGQVFLSNRNLLLHLPAHLKRGRSVALLADQSTIGGLPVDFFGRPALTTPIPALLAARHRRPIVVVACLRVGMLRFTGHMSAVIHAGLAADEREEVERLTREMARAMESLIRQYPDQYLWMHDRWKRYD